jgi:hypothetical protein
MKLKALLPVHPAAALVFAVTSAEGAMANMSRTSPSIEWDPNQHKTSIRLSSRKRPITTYQHGPSPTTNQSYFSTFSAKLESGFQNHQ